MQHYILLIPFNFLVVLHFNTQQWTKMIQ